MLATLGMHVNEGAMYYSIERCICCVSGFRKIRRTEVTGVRCSHIRSATRWSLTSLTTMCRLRTRSPCG